MSYDALAYEAWASGLAMARPTEPSYPERPEWENPPPGSGHIYGLPPQGPNPPASSSSSSRTTTAEASASPTTTPGAGVAAAGLVTAPSLPTSLATPESSPTTMAVPTIASGVFGTEYQAAEATSSSGMGRGTLFAAIFIPIASIAFICSLCMLCFLRRRKRLRREAARSLQAMRQESVEHLSAAGFSARQSRSIVPLGASSNPHRFSSSSQSSATRHGPLITVDGPSYSRPREEPPPPYKNGAPAGGSPGSRSPPRPPRPNSETFGAQNMSPPRDHARSPFADPEPHLAMYRLPQSSPFDDPYHDDSVSDIVSPVQRQPSTRDADSVSVVSAVSDGPTRTLSNSRRGL